MGHGARFSVDRAPIGASMAADEALSAWTERG